MRTWCTQASSRNQLAKYVYCDPSKRLHNCANVPLPAYGLLHACRFGYTFVRVHEQHRGLHPYSFLSHTESIHVRRDAHGKVRARWMDVLTINQIMTRPYTARPSHQIVGKSRFCSLRILVLASLIPLRLHMCAGEGVRHIFRLDHGLMQLIRTHIQNAHAHTA